jgi:S1-C subfamily serine protease
LNADTEADISYQAAHFVNDGRNEDKEFLVTKKFSEDSGLAIWGGGIKKGTLYTDFNGQKTIRVYDENGEFVEEIKGWDEESEKEAQRISEVVDEKKSNLDVNFELLDERLKQVRNFNPRENGSRKNTVIKPLASELVHSVQELLSILGYETGKIDGILGRITIAAIKAFQKGIELETTGRPSEDLLMQLQGEVRKLNNKNAKSEEAVNPVLPIIGTGTGFYINNNTIISNYHVVNTCNYISIGKEERLVVNAIDQVNDITVLESKRNPDAFLRLSANPKLGNNIFTAGFPYNDILKNFNFTSGNVSSLMGPGSNISEFQFTAPVQPGNSGGPILNSKGGVVGITVSGLGAKFAELADTLPQNINFGIKVGVLKDILTEQGIKFLEGNEFWFDSSDEKIADLSRQSSVLINCHAKPKL